jgi:hypothetical protein
VEKDGRLRNRPKVLTVMWHDRSRETRGYDPAISRKTCGLSNCHPDKVARFDGATMGANFRPRSMRVWNDVHGPNNCGPPFSDVAPDVPAEEAAFACANTGRIAENLAVPFDAGHAEYKQKVCNLCHTGCLLSCAGNDKS